MAAIERQYFVNRDLSWLEFNARVLQEAEDARNPLLERLSFLGIFSSNVDEFFRVRYAAIQRLAALEDTRKVRNQLGGWHADELLEAIREVVDKQYAEVDRIYETLTAELEQEGIVILKPENLTDGQKDFIRDYYVKKISPSIVTMILDEAHPLPELRDSRIYLAVSNLGHNSQTEPLRALVEVPSMLMGRFVELPKYGKHYVMYLDDVIRANLEYVFFIFKTENLSAHAFKISRDAEMDIDTYDISRNILQRIQKGLQGRKEGDPVRMNYDRAMPDDMKDYLLDQLGLSDADGIQPGGRYHNKRDLMTFPNVGGAHLRNAPLDALRHPDLDMDRSILNALRKRDVLLMMPYHHFSYIIRMLREAAMDPQVTRIAVTLYRVADQSRIVSALINAAHNGKQVKVSVELQARFDEKNNLAVVDKLRQAGVEVITGVPGLKVHCKVMLIERRNSQGVRERYALVGTGNFHEGTAKVYTDYHVLTTHAKICNDVARVFKFIEEPYRNPDFRYLMVSPHDTRPMLKDKIEREIFHAQSGQPAEILIKVNSLSSYSMAEHLYRASQAGVKIRLIVRGICCIKPAMPGISDNIEVISIVDRYLEHSRVYAFRNGGDWDISISSFDLMTRNLDKRVEVGVPILDKSIQREIMDHLELQWKDNVKSRCQNNEYRKIPGPKIQSQLAIHSYCQDQLMRPR